MQFNHLNENFNPQVEFLLKFYQITFINHTIYHFENHTHKKVDPTQQYEIIYFQIMKENLWV